MSRHHCRLITELIAFKQAEGGSVRSLAQELGVDETALVRFRSGVRSPSKRVLVKIIERYGQLRFVRDLVWHHMAAECREGYVAPEDDVFADIELPPDAIAELRACAGRLASETGGGGRGIYLLSADTALLTTAVRGLARACTAKRLRFALLRADQRVTARGLRAALAAPLVIVERIDFACEEVEDILRRRADLTRPCIVTSLRRPEDIADAHIRRIALSTMRLVEIPSALSGTNAPSPSATLHDAA